MNTLGTVIWSPTRSSWYSRRGGKQHGWQEKTRNFNTQIENRRKGLLMRIKGTEREVPARDKEGLE